MRTLTIHLPADVAHTLEIRAAIDDLRLSDGIELLLGYLVQEWKAGGL